MNPGQNTHIPHLSRHRRKAKKIATTGPAWRSKSFARRVQRGPSRLRVKL